MQKTEDFSLATHWMPRDTKETREWLDIGKINLDRVYKLFIIPDGPELDDNEIWLLDDAGQVSMIYMCVPGELVIIQDAIVKKIEIDELLVLSKEEASSRYHMNKADFSVVDWGEIKKLDDEITDERRKKGVK